MAPHTSFGRRARQLLSVAIALEAALPATELAAQTPLDIQWKLSSADGDTYEIMNGKTRRVLEYGVRKYGINLVWGGDWPKKYSTFRIIPLGEVKSPGEDYTLRYGQKVAIHVKGGGYLQHGRRSHGIDLKWSATPVYEWELRGGAAGESLRWWITNEVALFNVTTGRYLRYGERTYGINLVWSSDATTMAGVDTLTVTEWMDRQPIYQGYIPYTLKFPAFGSIDGQLLEIANIRPDIDTDPITLLIVLAGRSTGDCGNANAVVLLPPGKHSTPSDMEKIFGSKTPRLPVSIVSCIGTPTVKDRPREPITLTYTHLRR
jgi:hypothetical protein